MVSGSDGTRRGGCQRPPALRGPGQHNAGGRHPCDCQRGEESGVVKNRRGETALLKMFPVVDTETVPGVVKIRDNSNP